jgi:hypothetical protein
MARLIAVDLLAQSAPAPISLLVRESSTAAGAGWVGWRRAGRFLLLMIAVGKREKIDAGHIEEPITTAACKYTSLTTCQPFLIL